MATRPVVPAHDLRCRTKLFAVNVINRADSLPRTRTADIVGRQLVRSATSVGANYRAVCRAKSTADFIAKMSIVEEEADESIYWMELLTECGVTAPDDFKSLILEADQIVAMTIASIKTARGSTR